MKVRLKVSWEGHYIHHFDINLDRAANWIEGLARSAEEFLSTATGMPYEMVVALQKIVDYARQRAAAILGAGVVEAADDTAGGKCQA